MVKKILVKQISRISLRTVLVVPFVLQIFVAVGLTGYLSFRHGQKAVNDIAGQLRSEITARINQHLESYLASSHLANQINVNAIQTGNFDTVELRNFRKFLWRQMQEFETLKFIGLGTEEGEYIGWDRVEEQLIFSLLDSSTQGMTQDWQIDNQGNLTKMLDSYPNYDPRKRPWYQATVQASKPTWSDIYLSFGPEKLLIISANQPVYGAQGQLIGVASNSLSLAGISEFLSSLRIGKTGQTFIMEPNGLLVATSTQQKPFEVQNQKPQRLLAQDSTNKLISSTARYLTSEFTELSQIDSARQFSFKFDNERQFVQFTPFSDQFGLNWLIVIVVPEADFMAQIRANTSTTILLCLLALVVATGMGLVTARWLVQPMLTMGYAANALSKEEWQQQIPESGPRELSLLAQAFNRMSRQLQHSFAQLEYIAYHDGLTGLLSRSAFIDALQVEIQKSSNLFAVLFLDLDCFKVVNDSLGHLLGDELLIAVAQRIQLCLDSQATAARFGGDEFTLLLRDIHGVGDALTVAKQIHQALHQPFSLKGHVVFVSASIGIVLSNAGGKTPECFLRDADIATYHAKAEGKARYAVFDASMYTQAVSRLQLETDLRQGIERGEFEVYYQPIVTLKNRAIAGFEALIRWHHPTQGLMTPGKFIPIAEETGLIVHLGEWVLSQACLQMAAWQEQFPYASSLFMSVNLSVQQLLQPKILKRVGQILQDTGLKPENLKLEMTESMIVDNMEAASATLIQLRAAGIQLSIDDFGTGYSSLSYLHSFPLTTLKVDRSFVRRMVHQQESWEITKAIVSLAHNLGMQVIVEGIETPQQLAKLQPLECEYGQGYLFAPPLAAAAITKRLQSMSLQISRRHSGN